MDKSVINRKVEERVDPHNHNIVQGGSNSGR